MVIQRRYAELDALRGIAALLVVTFHCWDLGFWHPTRGVQRIMDWTPISLATNGRPSVILFFVLSGFVLACSLERSGAGFYARRICRVYIPFAAAILLSDLLYCIVQPQPLPGFPHWFTAVQWSEAPTPWLILKHLLMPGVTGSDTLDLVMWSLVIEMRVSLLFPLLFAFTRRWPVIALITAWQAYYSGAFQGGCESLSCTPIRGADASQTIAQTCFFLIFFVAGIVLACHRKLILERLALAHPALTGAATLVALYCMILPSTPSLAPWLPTDAMYGLGGSLMIALAIGSPAWRQALDRPVLRWLGRVSYSLYLTHMLILSALVHALYGSVPNGILVGLVLAVSLIVAQLFHRYVEAPAAALAAKYGRDKSRPSVTAALVG